MGVNGGMLVLSRYIDESITIDVPGMPRITITLVDIKGGKARIGVAAPLEVVVHRSEVAHAIDREAAKKVPLRDTIPPLRKGEGDSYGPPPETTRKERNDERQRGFAGGGQGS